MPRTACGGAAVGSRATGWGRFSHDREQIDKSLFSHVRSSKGPTYSSNIRILPEDLSGATYQTVKGGVEEASKEDAK